MSKIINDKYYTPINIANHCWDIVKDKIGFDNISYVIEPSVGNGAFYHYDIHPNIGYDIEPEINSGSYNIKQCDFLNEDIDYKSGGLIIGNPPYGTHMHTAILFLRSLFRLQIILHSYYLLVN